MAWNLCCARSRGDEQVIGRFALALAFLLISSPAPSAAQTERTPPRVFHLDEMVVVGDRMGSPIREAVAATSLLTREDIDALPAQTLPDVLRSVPGIVFVDRDGSGRLPMAVVRGFFGGGETSYVLLTVDGVPVNDDRTGLVEWTQIPLSEVERIEVLRGSASVMYGDGALGAVINVVTRGTQAIASKSMGIWGGSWGARGMEGAFTSPMAGGWLSVVGALDAEDGFRSHSRSTRSSGAASYHRVAKDGASKGFARFSFSRITNQEPGPLPEGNDEVGANGSLPAFSGDERTRTVADLAGGGSRTWGGDQRLDGALRLRLYDQDRTRTLLLAPSFGDTQRQADRAESIWGMTQYGAPLGPAELRLGIEGEMAGYDTRYRDPGDGSLLTEGQGDRLKMAAHAEVMQEIASRLKVHAGTRYDWVRPRKDASDGPRTSFSQWSPRLALNLAYSESSSAPGNLFVTWTRAFKAPTLDQLFDVRAIPTGVPGQDVVFANASLKPQRSTAVEVGFYQRLSLGSPQRFGEVSATAYRQWLDDEIDFDLRTFKYGNILRSKHTGLEASLRAVLSSSLELVHSATLTEATFRSSELAGNQLKNIPRTAFVTSAYLNLSGLHAVPGLVSLSVTHRARGSVFLDDENTTKLAGVNLVDAALTWRRGGLEGTLSGRNLFDVGFDTFAYLLFDPFQQAEVTMAHPGSGRGFTFKLTVQTGGS